MAEKTLPSSYRSVSSKHREKHGWTGVRRLPRLSSRLKQVFFVVILGTWILYRIYSANSSQLPSYASARPPFHLAIRHSGSLAPSINANFADPCIVRGEDGYWYSFGTNGNGKHIQVARATDALGQWSLLDIDAMPDIGWTAGRDFWAPDVRRLGDGSFIMYFSGRVPKDRHCIGISRAAHITGPYIPDHEPWVCPLDIGGAIDPAGFLDTATGRRYVVYKVDGNTLGHGGECDNTVAPQIATPLMLQEVDVDNGSTKIGEAVMLLDHAMDDGPLVEAPNLVLVGDVYVLFFSSHCFTNRKGYDIKYAWAQDVKGPYQRGEAGVSLLKAPQFGLEGPGSTTSSEQGNVLVFHGWCGKTHAPELVTARSTSEEVCSYVLRGPSPRDIITVGFPVDPVRNYS